MPLWIAGAVLVGALTAIQAHINGALGRALDDGWVAALISFGSGLLVVSVLAVLIPSGRAGLAALGRGVRQRTVPWWMLLGGFAGALTVATQGLAVATIGVALFTVGLVAGQTVNGIVLDRTGYGPAGVVAVTVPRLVGAGIVLVAVTLSLTGVQIERVPLWMLVLPFVAGAGIAWQQATNGRLRQSLNSALAATAVNFAGGTLALAVAVLVHLPWAELGELPSSPWLYTGGALGVVYIFLSASLVRRTGVLLLGLGSVVGLLATSVLLDAVWPPIAGPPLGIMVVAVVIALAGVVAVVVRRRPR